MNTRKLPKRCSYGHDEWKITGNRRYCAKCNRLRLKKFRSSKKISTDISQNNADTA
jgi:hypothetical protein